MSIKNLVCVGGLALLLCVGVGARAQVTFAFDSDPQAGTPGSTVTFNGTITNNTASTVFLNGDSFNLTGAGLTLDDTKFNTEAPLFLSAGASTGLIGIFDVAIDPTTAIGFYPGSFTIQGGADPTITDALVTTNFTVDVTAPQPAQTPEPGALTLLLGLGLPATVFARRRPRKA